MSALSELDQHRYISLSTFRRSGAEVATPVWFAASGGKLYVFTAGDSGRAAVSAAKMGLVGLARGLASEFAAQNIRVNVVSPGSIDTSRANPEWYQGRTPNAAGIPLGRQGSVDEIAATCLFLVTDDGGFITGQTIHANGGVAYY